MPRERRGYGAYGAPFGDAERPGYEPARPSGRPRRGRGAHPLDRIGTLRRPAGSSWCGGSGAIVPRWEAMVRLVLATMLVLATVAAPANALPHDPSGHDPTLIRQGDWYYALTTPSAP